MSFSLRVHGEIRDIEQAAWDGLLDATSTPFVRWAFLEALESTGCVSPDAGWWPRHLTLWRDDRLVAAAPAYIRSDSDGDFSRDWGWAAAIERAGMRYYPKLILSVPFTPVTGRRFLVTPGEPRGPAVNALLAAASTLAREEGLSSVHVLFPNEEDAGLTEAAGLARRADFQCHFINRGYVDEKGWLASMDSKRRNQAKREQAAPAQQGVTIRTVRGEEMALDHAKWAHEAYKLHRSTVTKLRWGRSWLNEAFFTKVFAAMPECCEVVAAHKDGRLVAGAWNVSSGLQVGGRLWGRYWGCYEELPFLHFNVCLYHSIRDCISRKIEVFEGGAGGEHKLSRGFELATTDSGHMFLDGRVDASMRGFIKDERSHRLTELASWRKQRGPKIVAAVAGTGTGPTNGPSNAVEEMSAPMAVKE